MHKGFLDALLAGWLDVKVVQLAGFLSSEND